MLTCLIINFEKILTCQKANVKTNPTIRIGSRIIDTVLTCTSKDSDFSCRKYNFVYTKRKSKSFFDRLLYYRAYLSLLFVHKWKREIKIFET